MRDQERLGRARSSSSICAELSPHWMARQNVRFPPDRVPCEGEAAVIFRDFQKFRKVPRKMRRSRGAAGKIQFPVNSCRSV